MYLCVILTAVINAEINLIEICKITLWITYSMTPRTAMSCYINCAYIILLNVLHCKEQSIWSWSKCLKQYQVSFSHCICQPVIFNNCIPSIAYFVPYCWWKAYCLMKLTAMDNVVRNLAVLLYDYTIFNYIIKIIISLSQFHYGLVDTHVTESQRLEETSRNHWAQLPAKAGSLQ